MILPRLVLNSWGHAILLPQPDISSLMAKGGCAYVSLCVKFFLFKFLIGKISICVTYVNKSILGVFNKL